MMISQKVAARLNEQVKHEFYSSWAYMAMAYSFETMGLPIFAKWFYRQAGEEREHAEKIARYLLDQGAEVVLTALPEPKTKYTTAQEIIEAALEHEKLVTRQIHEIAELALAEKDQATYHFNGWFVGEQVEEVASVMEILNMVKLASTPGQLLQLEGRIYQMMEK
ncbi:MAG: ferritin [Candidatus Zixiibacteriota bacterium]